MNKKFFSLVVLVSLISLAAAFLAPAQSLAQKDTPNEKHERVCSKSKENDSADCFARVIVDQAGSPKTTSLPNGYGPAQFLGAYSLTPTVSAPTTIAIVDAYDHPNILSDLNFYSTTFGIPTLAACPVSSGTPASPCFQKVNQNGGTSYPRQDAGWALEIALDVEAAHAVCQNCNILLVEASSNSYANLMTAVDRARLMGATVISNSYGSGEFSSEASFDNHFNFPGLAFTFSSGDSGFGTGYPAASPYVTAVGGTTLNLSGNNYLSETAWSGSGSGCSLYEPQPSWQTSLGLSGCAKRIIADVSAVADPNTGAAVYDTVRYGGRRGWFKVGGTSLSAPLIAAVYALKGIPSGVAANSLPYLNNPLVNLHDVTLGSNGSCGGSYLCTALSGYDGPTGLGSPWGNGAF